MQQFPVQDVYKKIPASALERFEKELAPASWRLCLEGMRQKRHSSFRLNLLKGERSQILASLRQTKLRFRDFAEIDQAFLLESTEKELEKTDVYKEGQVYLQGLSGMLAPLFLAPKAGEKVLDMAAAPGSKTTMMASMMNNQGSIDAIEPDFIRLERLKFNCDVLGVTNVEFHKAQAEKFFIDQTDVYDAILADVPCSGEGRFNLYDTPSYIFWDEKKIQKFVNLQTKILRNGVRLLKPGGRILYSTCTLNNLENETVIQTVLAENPNLKTIPVPVPETHIPEYQILKKGGLHALRITPSPRFEGFFLCLMEKR